ncbi:MAG: hypothetical protein WBF93_14495 [Pirellulales bacterium]|nr:hypothetical protein [Pirellulales bacterium]
MNTRNFVARQDPPLRQHPREARLRCLAARTVALAVLAACTMVSIGHAADPEIEEIELTTGDGKTLMATYYQADVEALLDPDEKEEKAEDPDIRQDVVPVMIFPDWKERAADYEDLALYLQSLGHAVIIPNFRAHEAKALTKDDIIGMIKFDAEAVKNFLIEKNDEKELNVDKICLIGVQLGGLVALNWAVKDWSWPQLLRGKQGQDVKALILVSPLTTRSGVKADAAFLHPAVRAKLSYLLLVGNEDKRAFSHTNKIYGRLKRFNTTEPPDKKLFLFPHETSLQGLDLLEQDDLKSKNRRYIELFIKSRIVDQKHRWQKRGADS